MKSLKNWKQFNEVINEGTTDKMMHSWVPVFIKQVNDLLTTNPQAHGQELIPKAILAMQRGKYTAKEVYQVFKDYLEQPNGKYKVADKDADDALNYIGLILQAAQKKVK